MQFYLILLISLFMLSCDGERNIDGGLNKSDVEVEYFQSIESVKGELEPVFINQNSIVTFNMDVVDYAYYPQTGQIIEEYREAKSFQYEVDIQNRLIYLIRNKYSRKNKVGELTCFYDNCNYLQAFWTDLSGLKSINPEVGIFFERLGLRVQSKAMNLYTCDRDFREFESIKDCSPFILVGEVFSNNFNLGLGERSDGGMHRDRQIEVKSKSGLSVSFIAYNASDELIEGHYTLPYPEHIKSDKSFALNKAIFNSGVSYHSVYWLDDELDEKYRNTIYKIEEKN